MEYTFHFLALRKSLLKSKAHCWETSFPSIVQQPTQQLRLGSRQKEDGGTSTLITLHLVDFLSIIKVDIFGLRQFKILIIRSMASSLYNTG